ncbi:hypothetical protein Tco_0805677, partial [Tanacetum coccineum]
MKPRIEELVGKGIDLQGVRGNEDIVHEIEEIQEIVDTRNDPAGEVEHNAEEPNGQEERRGGGWTGLEKPLG